MIVHVGEKECREGMELLYHYHNDMTWRPKTGTPWLVSCVWVKTGVTAKSFFLVRQWGRVMKLAVVGAKQGTPSSWLMGECCCWSFWGVGGRRGWELELREIIRERWLLLEVILESLSLARAPGLRYRLWAWLLNLYDDFGCFGLSLIIVMMAILNEQSEYYEKWNGASNCCETRSERVAWGVLNGSTVINYN